MLYNCVQCFRLLVGDHKELLFQWSLWESGFAGHDCLVIILLLVIWGISLFLSNATIISYPTRAWLLGIVRVVCILGSTLSFRWIIPSALSSDFICVTCKVFLPIVCLNKNSLLNISVIKTLLTVPHYPLTSTFFDLQTNQPKANPYGEGPPVMEIQPVVADILFNKAS